MEKSKDNNPRMFPKFWEAVEAIAKCCDKEKPILARSEVYNETWMLRLMLARIYDFDGDFEIVEPKKKALIMIRNAVRRNWISEGGLSPAFEKEGTTWTDAILGDVELREYDDGDGDKRKVGFKPKRGGDCNPCVVIVEAKMGSTLSRSVTNSADYDQAARNIACLSKLFLGVPTQKVDGAFFVFMPKDSEDSKKTEEAQELISKASDTIIKQLKKRTAGTGKNKEKEILGRSYVKDIEGKDALFREIVEGIIKQGANDKPISMVLTWDEILTAMNNGEDYTSGIINDTQKLRIFYEESLKEISKQKE